MSQMEEIQKITLEIFKQVAEICEKNEIRYFALAGTCLGAVRHQGFIPWDDDLDITMPLDDFKKFIEIFQKEKPEHLVLFSPATVKHDYQFFVKVMDDRTMMTENGFRYWVDTYEGVWIDIFPMSGFPNSEEEGKKFQKQAHFYYKLSTKAKKKLSAQKSLKAKAYWILISPIRLFPQDFIWKRWINLIQQYPFDSSKYVGQVWGGKETNLIFLEEWYENYIYLNFEDTKIKCPKGYKEYLTLLYGDYMEYPPEAQRNSGHYFDNGVIDLEHSFKDYQSGKYRIK